MRQRCPICKDAGQVFSPKKENIKTVYVRDGFGGYEKKEVTRLMGGVDGCPQCASIAESEYQERVTRRADIGNLEKEVDAKAQLLDRLEHDDSPGLAPAIGAARREYYKVLAQLAALIETQAE